MSSINPKSQVHTEQFRAPRITFVSEQDGVPERELKSQLNQLFVTDKSILRAYLARVSYGNLQNQPVALCLRYQVAPDKDLLERIAKVFASMFGNHEHLDIVFIDDTEETELRKYCNPFFNSRFN